MTAGGSIGAGVSYALDFPAPCVEAMRVAHRNRAFVDALSSGGEIKHSITWDGSLRENAAFLTIPVHGDRGSAVLHARMARLADGRWVAVTLQSKVRRHARASTARPVHGPLGHGVHPQDAAGTMTDLLTAEVLAESTK